MSDDQPFSFATINDFLDTMVHLSGEVAGLAQAIRESVDAEVSDRDGEHFENLLSDLVNALNAGDAFRSGGGL